MILLSVIDQRLSYFLNMLTVFRGYLVQAFYPTGRNFSVITLHVVSDRYACCLGFKFTSEMTTNYCVSLPFSDHFI